ncbi:MAG: hypothetical protein HY764_04810 [Candidatus Portnoybacteria bacterium]|nr:hypothetical protein [Candidatus Portnoybacteria bacterium]
MSDMQCLVCSHHAFFKPMSNDTFVCCIIRGETAHDIDLRKGFSAAIKKYCFSGENCELFKSGPSICATLPEYPFDVPLIRLKGEKVIL